MFRRASVREIGLGAPTPIRPEFTGPDAFVDIAGVVNTTWLIGIGVMIILLIRWQSEALQLRINAYSWGSG